jgi:hypothetical protein
VKKYAASIIQAAGALVASLGVALVYAPAGVILAGVSAVVFGVAMERN